MRIKRTVLAIETSYLILPEGIRCKTIDEAISKRGSGTIREYTVTIKRIEVFADTRRTEAEGTYVTSKEIKSAEHPVD